MDLTEVSLLHEVLVNHESVKQWQLILASVLLSVAVVACNFFVSDMDCNAKPMVGDVDGNEQDVERKNINILAQFVFCKFAQTETFVR